MNKDTSSLVSIIIPFYNVENYIRRCLLSIYSQDYMDVEVILVDDGSTDNSVEIVKDIIARNSIYKSILISKANGGQSSARNEGLKHVNGEYIWFIDSDDYIEPGSISLLVKTMQEHPQADICCFRNYFYDGQEQRLSGNNFILSEITNKDVILKDVFLGKNIKVALWNKLFKSQLLLDNKIHFLEGVINEDYLFIIESCVKVKGVCFLNTPLYTAVVRPNSVSRNIKPHTITDYFIIVDNLKDFLQKENLLEKYKDYYDASITKQMLFSLVQCAFKVDSYQSYKELSLLTHDTYYLDKKTSNHIILLGIKYLCLYRLSLKSGLFYIAMRLLKKMNVFMY